MRFVRHFARAATFAAVTLLPAPLHAQFDAIRSEIARVLVDEGIPSISVAVAKDGEIIWEEAFGWADREKRVPASEHTMYSLASISKPITATGLMILVERGVIDLDKPINEYLGPAKLTGRAGDANRATVRRVANHTSGLPLHYQFFYADEPYVRPHMDETIRRYANLVTRPGERWQYSNLGFGVIDYVIARQSGKTYPAFLREEVFIPLGMTRTSVDIGPGLEEFTATRYAADGSPIPFYDFDHPGGSAVFSSAHDLIRFGMFHLKNRLPEQRAIISDRAIDEMARATAETSSTSGYGVGWGSAENDKGLRLVRHSGGMGGVSTQLVLVPSHNIAITVLSNASSRWPSTITNRILATLLPDKFDPPVAGNNNSAPDPEFVPAADLVGKWEGTVYTYEGNLPLILDVRRGGDILVRLGAQPLTLLNNTSFDDGFLRGFFAGDIGTEDVNRRPYRLRLEVRLRGRILNGSLIGQSLPNNRVGNALTHWVELEKQ